MTTPTPTDLAPRRAHASLGTMRLIAGGLLILMAALFVWASSRSGGAPAWGYVAAFAEAAMVGGLADWFAVTALFRRPLGLPIPHTAVIPRNQERIAQSLGDFVAVNFLAPEVIGPRLKDQDLASTLARQLADAATAQRIANGLIDALPALADLLDDKVVSAFLSRQIQAFGRDGRLTSLIGQSLEVLTENGRHQPVFDALIREGWKALEENETAIRTQVRERTGPIWRFIGLDTRAADALIGALEDTLQAMAADPEHPARQRITSLLRDIAFDLQHDPKLRESVQRVIADMLAHPSAGLYLESVWSDVKQTVRDMAAAPDARAREGLAEALTQFGNAMLADAEVLGSVNIRLRAFLTELSGRYGPDLGHLITETIRGWDTATVVGKLEQNVGPDLQYIRINGTLIGGLIGLAIHQISLWLH